jgi:hypothetical protein
MSFESTIAIVASSIAVVLFIFGIAYWKGRVDGFLKSCTNLPERTSSLEMKMDVLWALFVDNVLESRPNLANRGSGYKLTPESEEYLKEIQHVIDDVKKEKPALSPSDTLTIVAQRVGMLELQKIAKKNGCTLSEYFSILTIKLGVNV